MDHEWNYYVQDVAHTEPAAACQQKLNSLCYRMDPGQHTTMRTALRGIFQEYRNRDKKENAAAEAIITAHMQYCVSVPDPGALKRRHNAVVYKYMIATALSNKAVARKMMISQGTVSGDIVTSIHEMLVIIYGLPAAGSRPETWVQAIQQLMVNYHLIEYSPAVLISILPKSWQNVAQKCRAITEEALHFLQTLLTLYEGFVAGVSLPEYQQRPIDIIKSIYITDHKSIQQVAAEWDMDDATVYKDIKKGIARLAELCMAMGASIETRTAGTIWKQIYYPALLDRIKEDLGDEEN